MGKGISPVHHARHDPPCGVVHLFPGQGGFSLGALVRAVRRVPALRRSVTGVCEEVADVAAEFGIPPLAERVLSQHPPSGKELAAGPVGTPQLALFCSSLAVHRALCDSGLPPRRMVGVSFGEIAALTASGVFDAPGGARIACLLARHLRECPGGMTVLGAGEERARALVREAGAAELVPACVNDPGETVLSGPTDALLAAERLAQRQGLPCSRLRLPFSSHHPSLQGPADAFAAAIRSVPARRGRLPVHSAVRGGPYRATDDLHRGLADCMVRPVRLPEIFQQVTAVSSPALMLEAGTGRALTRNVRRTRGRNGLPATVRALAPLGDHGFPWPDTGPDRPCAPVSVPPLPTEPPL